MAKAKLAPPRSVLAQQGARVMTFAEWLSRNPAAEKFVREWVEMRISGETNWSTAEVMKYLRVTYKSSFTGHSVLIEWLARVGLTIHGRRT
jgi:hypothetical protein